MPTPKSRPKKGNAFSIRLEPELSERVAAMEKASMVSKAEMVRQVLDALARHYEKYGKIEFPIDVIPSAELQNLQSDTIEEIAAQVAEKERDSIMVMAIEKIQEMVKAEFEGLRAKGFIHPGEEYFPDETADHLPENVHFVDFQGGIAAGAPIGSDVREEPLPVGKEYPEDHYALKVFGQSMEPKIRDQSTIIVRRFQDKGFPKKGTIVVYNDGHGATLKVFGYRKAKEGEDGDIFNNIPTLSSLNPAFKEVQTMEGGRIDAVFVEVL